MLKYGNMRKIFFVNVFSILFTTTALSQIKKVNVSYNEPETYVILEEELIGVCPEFIKIDFAIGGDLIFYKPGFYSYRIGIDQDNQFNKLGVELVRKPKNIALESKKLLKLDTLVVSSVVTNMTLKNIQEIIEENFINNNYYMGKGIDLFPNAKDEIENCRYKIAIEIVDSKQIRHVYKAPRFMLGYIKIRWSLLDLTTNKVVYFNTTEGINFIKVSKTKGIVVSELMKRVMKGAIKEAQFKILADKKFVELIND